MKKTIVLSLLIFSMGYINAESQSQGIDWVSLAKTYLDQGNNSNQETSGFNWSDLGKILNSDSKTTTDSNNDWLSNLGKIFKSEDSSKESLSKDLNIQESLTKIIDELKLLKQRIAITK